MAQTQDYLTRLKPKINKRSINALGTAWKWLSGSPDEEDFRVLTDHINNALENNNNQIIINKVINERMNNITEISNKILALLKSKENIQHDVAINIKYKLQILKDEIVNINYAIHWAKAGIINSYLFSNTEMNLIKQIFVNDNIPFNIIEESFEFANVKIASNNSMILYIIDIPITDENVCESILIKALKKGIKINKIQFEKILLCKNKIFGLRNNCEEHNEVKICRNKNIIDISNSSCIPNLLKSHPPTCTTINNQHIPSVEEILPGIILLNQYDGIVSIDHEEINLTGSYAIEYHNSLVTIDKQVYLSKESSGSKPLPAILQPKATQTTEEEMLSLEMMKELHLKNIKYIEELKSNSLTTKLTSLGISGITLTLMAILAWKLMLTRTSKLTGKYITNINDNISLKEISIVQQEQPQPQIRMDQMPIQHPGLTNEDVRF